jgi:hypothetical protein
MHSSVDSVKPLNPLPIPAISPGQSSFKETSSIDTSDLDEEFEEFQ